MNDFIRDLIADIRFCDKCIAADLNTEENINYKNQCLIDLRKCLAVRHSTNSLNQYGYPKVLS